jgi:hypothetical protein
VLGVYRDERSCWVQVSADGDARTTVVVKCSHFATPAHVQAVLARWVPKRALSLIVLQAMAIAS